MDTCKIIHREIFMNKKLITLFSVFTFIFIAVFSILSFNKAYAADMGLNKTSLSLHTGENYILKVKNLSKTHSTVWSVKNKKRLHIYMEPVERG